MWRILQGDWIERLKELPSESVHCVVTSPPYWGLRDYGTATWEGGSAECDHIAGMARGDTDRETPGGKGGSFRGGEVQFRDLCGKCSARRIDQQLGLERTPEEYVAKMVDGFREVRRVLRKDGTCWLNLGDSYAGSTMTGGNNGINASGGEEGFKQQRQFDKPRQSLNGLKPKDLCGIPWMVAFALRADGWWLRQDIIWSKPNPMPESVTDRCTKAHEYLFLLTKSERYYFDNEAIKEDAAWERWGDQTVKKEQPGTASWITARPTAELQAMGKRNRRSVWEIATSPFPEAHFATFPPKLVEPCILAGTSEKGCCPECAAPWERMVEKDVRFESGSGKAGNPPNGKNGSEYEQALSGDYDIRMGPVTETRTLGWQPTCKCGSDLEDGDLEIIASPTGERAGDDPSLLTGRAGMNRPRGENEGQRPITRYEQRKYAEQLKDSTARPSMEAAAGAAFAHYVRTDRSGARPIPGELLESWIEHGWLQRVIVPAVEPLPPVPCTVLDPFSGAGTTGLVALRFHRNFIGIELSPEYARMAEQRITQDAPLFNTPTQPIELHPNPILSPGG